MDSSSGRKSDFLSRQEKHDRTRSLTRTIYIDLQRQKHAAEWERIQQHRPFIRRVARVVHRVGNRHELSACAVSSELETSPPQIPTPRLVCSHESSSPPSGDTLTRLKSCILDGITMERLNRLRQGFGPSVDSPLRARKSWGYIRPESNGLEASSSSEVYDSSLSLHLENLDSSNTLSCEELATGRLASRVNELVGLPAGFCTPRRAPVIDRLVPPHLTCSLTSGIDAVLSPRVIRRARFGHSLALKKQMKKALERESNLSSGEVDSSEREENGPDAAEDCIIQDEIELAHLRADRTAQQRRTPRPPPAYAGMPLSSSEDEDRERRLAQNHFNYIPPGRHGLSPEKSRVPVFDHDGRKCGVVQTIWPGSEYSREASVAQSIPSDSASLKPVFLRLADILEARNGPMQKSTDTSREDVDQYGTQTGSMTEIETRGSPALRNVSSMNHFFPKLGMASPNAPRQVIAPLPRVDDGRINSSSKKEIVFVIQPSECTLQGERKTERISSSALVHPSRLAPNREVSLETSPCGLHPALEASLQMSGVYDVMESLLASKSHLRPYLGLPPVPSTMSAQHLSSQVSDSNDLSGLREIQSDVTSFSSISGTGRAYASIRLRSVPK